jgi:3-oxoacyl-[acyl-carrier-protein] synthase-3
MERIPMASSNLNTSNSGSISNSLSGYKRSRISGFGSAFPSQVLTNHDLEKIVDTSDQWISERTGIKERRKLRDDEQNSDLGAEAALKAIAAAGIKPDDVDMVIACTTTSDRWMPSMAAIIQAKIGANNGGSCFDLLSACAGWMSGLELADSLVRTGARKNVLVIGAEALSRFVNWKDRSTCVLFGDAAGASVITGCEPGAPGELLDIRVGSDGRFGDILDLPGGGSQFPPSPAMLEKNFQFIRMNGQEVYKHAVRNMVGVCEEIMKAHDITVDDIDWFVPHQANVRIIETIGKRLGFPMEKVAMNLQKYGNTSSATVPTCFDEYARDGRIKRGQLVLMTTFGGGITWAGGLVRW